MNCSNCGAPLIKGAAFCGACGTPVAPQPTSPQPVPNYQESNQQYQQSSGQYQQQAYYQQPSGQYQQAGQSQYQQQPYQQPQPVQQVWPPQTATNRAFAMTIYVSNLLGIIFALCVRDKDNQFITHHLNNAVVILIGAVISGLLMVVVVGFILAIYLVVMSIMGIVSAYNGDMKELPLIGKIHIIK